MPVRAPAHCSDGRRPSERSPAGVCGSARLRAVEALGRPGGAGTSERSSRTGVERASVIPWLTQIEPHTGTYAGPGLQSDGEPVSNGGRCLFRGVLEKHGEARVRHPGDDVSRSEKAFQLAGDRVQVRFGQASPVALDVHQHERVRAVGARRSDHVLEVVPEKIPRHQAGVGIPEDAAQLGVTASGPVSGFHGLRAVRQGGQPVIAFPLELLGRQHLGPNEAGSRQLQVGLCSFPARGCEPQRVGCRRRDDSQLQRVAIGTREPGGPETRKGRHQGGQRFPGALCRAATTAARALEDNDPLLLLFDGHDSLLAGRDRVMGAAASVGEKGQTGTKRVHAKTDEGPVELCCGQNGRKVQYGHTQLGRQSLAVYESRLKRSVASGGSGRWSGKNLTIGVAFMHNDRGLTVEELDAQHAAELPDRSLLIGVSLLGIPLVGVDGIAVNVDTSGPNWLFGSVGSV